MTEQLVKTYVICFVRADNGILWPWLLFVLESLVARQATIN